jgi:hypothetical protein
MSVLSSPRPSPEGLDNPNVVRANAVTHEDKRLNLKRYLKGFHMSFPRKQGPMRRDLSDWAVEVDTSGDNERLGIWVPDFAGTTLKLLAA